MKTLLVSVDFSSASRSVVDAASGLAKSTEARVILHHSLQPPIVTTEYGIGIAMMQETLAIAEKGARHQLEHIEDEFTALGIEADSVLTEGAASPHIVDLARKRKADLIVLGSHGHTALYDLIVGSTTNAVLRKAPCPVMIVSARETKAKKRKR
jgi:nucleotide-binding universal stress UspA family protein